MRCVCMQICETSRIRHLHIQKLSCIHVCMQTCDCVCRFGTKSFYGDARGHKTPALGPEEQPEPLYSCCICGRFFLASHPWQQIILHVDQPSGWIQWGRVCAFWPQCNQWALCKVQKLLLHQGPLKSCQAACPVLRSFYCFAAAGDMSFIITEPWGFFFSCACLPNFHITQHIIQNFTYLCMWSTTHMAHGMQHRLLTCTLVRRWSPLLGNLACTSYDERAQHGLYLVQGFMCLLCHAGCRLANIGILACQQWTPTYSVTAEEAKDLA